MLQLIFFGFLYFALYQLGISFYFGAENVATLWPAAGFVLGALLVTKRSDWLRLLLVAAIIQVILNLSFSVPFALIATLANTLGPVLEVLFIRRFFPDGFDLTSIRKVLIFFVIVLTVEAFTALLGAGGVVINVPAVSYWGVWQVWWFSTALGVLIVAPAFASLQRGTRMRRIPTGPELLIMIVSLFVVTFYVFAIDSPQFKLILQVPYLIIPFFIWIAARFPARFTHAILVLVSFAVTYFTDQGYGPFILPEQTTSELVLILQAFLSVSAFSAFIVLAAVRELRITSQALTENQQTLASYIHAMPDLLFIFNEDGKYLDVSVSEDNGLLYAPGDKLKGNYVQDVLPEQTGQIILGGLKKTVQSGKTQIFEYNLPLPFGFKWFEARTALMDLNTTNKRIVFVARDITDRKYAERELMRYSERIRILHEIDRGILASTSVDEISSKTLERLQYIIPFNTAGLNIVNHQAREIIRLGFYIVGQGGIAADEIPADYDRFEKIIQRIDGGQLLHIGDILEEPEWQQVLENLKTYPFVMDTRSALVIPLMVEHSMIGMLTMVAEDTHAFSRDDIEIAEQVANQVAIAINQSQLLAEIQTQVDELKVLNDLVLAGTQAQNLSEFLTDAANRIGRTLYQESFSIGMVDREGGIIKFYLPDNSENIYAEFPELPIGVGIVSAVVASGEPRIDDDIRQAPEYAGSDPHRRSQISVPLKFEREVIGVISAESARLAAFTQSDENLLSTIAGHLVTVIEKLGLFEAEQRSRRFAETLAAASARLVRVMDTDTVLESLLDYIYILISYDTASIFIVEESKAVLRLMKKGVETIVLPEAVEFDFQQNSILKQIQQTGEGVIISDTQEHPDWETTEPGAHVRSWMGAPLLSGDEFLGFYSIDRREPHAFSWQDLRMAEALAAHASIALKNARLFEDLQISQAELIRSYDETLEGWAKALELRDIEIEGHSRRVTNLAVRFAWRLRLTGSELVNIRRGALLHDIGKMGIPDSILHKPGPLDDKEWAIMKQHTTYAYKLIGQVDNLKSALDIPLYHHENWDGSGYPEGLKGEQIPMAARMFALVDQWDALHADRVYRPAWPREKIIAYMRENSGKIYDPQLLEVFLQLVSELD